MMKYYRSMLLALVATPLFATTYNVSTTQELTDAIGSAADGDEIVLAAGTYSISSVVTISKGVTIRGVASDRTLAKLNISAAGNYIVLDHADAALKDLSVQGACPNANDRGRVQISANGGLLSNCRFYAPNPAGTKGPFSLMMKGGRATGCGFINGGTRDTCGAVEINGANAMFDHCTVTGCTTGSGGGSQKGAVYLKAGIVSDCLVYNNTVKSSDATGIYIGGAATVRNCTIIGNKSTVANYNGAGIYWPNNANAKVYNNIIVGNLDADGNPADVKLASTTSASIPSCFLNNLLLSDIGTDCQVVSSISDILFTDAANRDYTLLTGSPAIDHGTSTPGISETDLAGISRSLGSAVDIGCYEFDASVVVINFDFAADKTACSLGQSITLTPEVEGVSGVETYLWEIVNDSTFVTNTFTTSTVVFTPTVDGTYSVTLTVSEGGTVETVTKPSYLTANEFKCSFVADKTAGIADASFSFTSTVLGSIGDVTYSWSFTNETTGVVQTSTAANPVFTSDAPGQITVALSVTDGNRTVTNCAANYLSVQVGACYVVTKNTNAAYPYDTWAKAATNIVDAINACGPGGDVILSNGTHSVKSTITISKALAIRGFDPDRTKVSLAPSDGAKYLILDHAEAMLSDLTVAGTAPNIENRGRIQISSNGGVVSNCCFTGGGVKGPTCVVMKGGRVTDCAFNGNGARDTCGAVLIDSADALFDHNIVRDAGTVPGGTGMNGVIYLKAGTVSDCLVYNNTIQSKKASGIVMTGAGTVRNCTIVGNKSTGGDSYVGSGLYWTDNSNGKVYNNIIVWNLDAAGASSDVMLSNGNSANIANCILNNLLLSEIGTDCQVVDSIASVGFTDAANNDYSLLQSSPAVDHGTASFGLSATDFAGNDRVMGSAVDIGAYECDTSVMYLSFDVSGMTEGFPSAEFSFVSSISGFTNPVYAWTVKQGETVKATGNVANPSFTLNDYGAYDVYLTVTEGAGPKSKSYSLPACVRVARTVYNVPADMTIDEAVADAIDTSVIKVTGTNNATATLVVSKVVTIEGTTGSATDRIIGNGSSSVVKLNTAAAKLKGLSISGGGSTGNNGHGCGVFIDSNGGIVEDCVIEGNKAGHYGTGVGLYMDSSAAFVRRTIIRDNSAKYQGYDVGSEGTGVYITKGILESSLITGNNGSTLCSGLAVASKGAHVKNCTIANNDGPSAIYFTKDCLNGGIPEIVNTVVAENYKVENNEHVTVGWGLPYAYPGYPAYNTNNLVRAFTKCAMDGGIPLPVVVEKDNDDNDVEVAADILWIDDAKFKADGTYRLIKDSPLREAGVWQEWMTGETDLYGEPRAYESNRKRHNATIGCASYPPKTGTLLMVK